MGLDRRMQYFIEKILPIIWARYLIPVHMTYPTEPTATKFREISPELIELTSKAIWVQSKIAFHHWVLYLRKYYDRMVSSPKLFVMYVIYACNTMGLNIKDHYERFVTVCSLLVGFGANFHYSGNGEVLKYIPKILAVFFERVLMAQFTDRGGWKRLDKYLSRQDYLSWHDETQIPPDETATERVTREMIFAKKVEAAIKASACNDYDADRISEKDVECDLVTVKISDEVMQHFPAPIAEGPEGKGSVTQMSGTTSQPCEGAEDVAKAKMAQGLMEIVQRARLASEETAKQIAAASGAACSIRPQTETFSMQIYENLQGAVSACKTLKPKRQKTSKNTDAISVSSNTLSVGKTHKEKIRSESGNRKSVDISHKFTEEASDQSTFVVLEDKQSALDKLKSNEEIHRQKSLELLKDVESLFASSSKKPNVQNTYEVPEAKSVPFMKSTEGIDQQTASNILGDGESVYSHPKSGENLMKETFQDVGESKSDNNRETIEDISQQKSANQTDDLVASALSSTEAEDVQIAPKSKEDGVFVTDCEQSNESDKQNQASNQGDGGLCSFDMPKFSDYPEGSASASATSINAKLKSKHEAMKAIITIIRNLAPKIDMFVTLLDSLVWDLKKDS